MTTDKLTRRGLVSLLIAASVASSAIAAEDEARLAAPKRAVLPCCKCLGDSTSVNLSTGANGVTWTAAVPNSSAQNATATSANPAWTTMLAPMAQWISPSGNPTTTGVYTYQTQFDARNCTVPSDITISGKFLADNSAVLLVDDKKVASSVGTPNYGFLPGSLTSFSYTIPASAAAGVHTVTVQAQNSSGPTGIVVQLTATRHCSSNLEKDRG